MNRSFKFPKNKSQLSQRSTMEPILSDVAWSMTPGRHSGGRAAQVECPRYSYWFQWCKQLWQWLPSCFMLLQNVYSRTKGDSITHPTLPKMNKPKCIFNVLANHWSVDDAFKKVWGNICMLNHHKWNNTVTVIHVTATLPAQCLGHACAYGFPSLVWSNTTQATKKNCTGIFGSPATHM